MIQDSNLSALALSTCTNDRHQTPELLVPLLVSPSASTNKLFLPHACCPPLSHGGLLAVRSASARLVARRTTYEEWGQGQV